MKKYIFLVTSILLVACTQTGSAPVFALKLDMVMKKNDSIQVFYTTDGTINFTEGQSFWTRVNGAKHNQTIILPLPNDTIPTQLRIDFGRNRQQDDVVLNKIEIQYQKKAEEIKGRDIYTYFRVDDSYTVLDKDLGLLKRKQPGQLNGPSLYPNGEMLRQKLAEITTDKK